MARLKFSRKTLDIELTKDGTQKRLREEVEIEEGSAKKAKIYFEEPDGASTDDEEARHLGEDLLDGVLQKIKTATEIMTGMNLRNISSLKKA
ncbi:hypothetical protein N0V84_002514 [Fusarium piperis]|uniref:Uncharacterized protein n=1 Tax=Fusarium piperis TaxID=1435070 RepID=A0A9W9BS00_9HYPO|nr:hypothetical protein N0V84_002514 [Fusarium piperis]